MKSRYILPIFIYLLIQGCSSHYDHSELKNMLRSDNVESLIKASYYIAKNKDTSMVADIMYNMDDGRVTHLLKHNGMSVYYLKLYAMEEITGVLPPNKSTNRPDSVNIKFYSNLARKKGWIE